MASQSGSMESLVAWETLRVNLNTMSKERIITCVYSW